MFKQDKTEEHKKILRWFCGVPVFLNPLILMDLLSALALLWFFTVLLMALVQFFFGSGALLASHLSAASIYASYLVGFSFIIFIGVALFFYPRGYVVLYRLEQTALYMESMRVSVPAGNLFRIRPFVVGSEFAPRRSVVKEGNWNDFRGIRVLESMNVILLKGRLGSSFRLYCPDKTTFSEALNFVKVKITNHG